MGWAPRQRARLVRAENLLWLLQSILSTCCSTESRKGSEPASSAVSQAYFVSAGIVQRVCVTLHTPCSPNTHTCIQHTHMRVHAHTRMHTHTLYTHLHKQTRPQLDSNTAVRLFACSSPIDRPVLCLYFRSLFHWTRTDGHALCSPLSGFYWTKTATHA